MLNHHVSSVQNPNERTLASPLEETMSLRSKAKFRPRYKQCIYVSIYIERERDWAIKHTLPGEGLWIFTKVQLFHSLTHSPAHYRRTRSEHHIASSGCRLQTTVSCETSVKNGRWRKVCAVRVTKFARPTGYHLELTPGLNYYRKNPKCGQTDLGINMKSVRNI